MVKKEKLNLLKIFIFIIAVLLVIGIIAYLFPILSKLYTSEGRIQFKEKVSELGVVGFLILFALQASQIILFILPGEPIEILAGMCYGEVWGTIFVMFSNFIISAFIFFLVRKFGRKFVYNLCSKEKISKIEKSKLFQNPKKIELIMLILFFIPGTPKDLLVYVAGLLPIKLSRFLLISTFARFPSVISSTLAGKYIVVGNWKMSILFYAIVLAIVGVLIFIFNKFDKDKITDEALNTIK